MTARIFTRALKDRRLSIFGWIGGATALTSFLLSIYPVLRSNPAVEQMIQRIPRSLLATFGIDPALYMTGVGFLEAQLYTMVGPLLLISFMLGAGAAATAGEEEQGTIDLLLANPLGRASLLLQKFAAAALLAGLIVLAITLTVLIGNEPAGLGLGLRGVLGINLALWLLGLFFGAIALAVGAWFGRRLLAVGVGAGIAVVSFFWAGLAPMSAQLRGTERFSPFFWYTDGHPALVGPTMGHAQLAGAAVLLLGIAWLGFARRDLRTETTRRKVNGSTVRRKPSSMLRTLTGTAVWERRRGLVWWMLGLYGMAAGTMAFWPTIRRDPGVFAGLMDSVPKEFFAMFGVSDPSLMLTAGGFLSSRLYSSIGLVLAIAYGIGFGTRAVAGNERAGHLELLLGLPVSRTHLVRSRLAAMVILLTLLCGGLGFAIWIGDAALDLGIRTESILAANTGLFLIALLFGTIALAIGSATGRPSLARGAAIAVAFGGFILNALGVYSDWFAPLRPLSPFAWYLGSNPPLTRGFDEGHLVLAAASLALAAVAVATVGRRDITR
ncbi:MAG: ABC transporter permease subunit [Planctomycetota bacterium]|jgi:ABC-2 type transport system permease protein